MNDVAKYGVKSCISHCLKTPLQKILGALHLKLEDDAESAVWEQDRFVTYLLSCLSEDKNGQFVLNVDPAKIQTFYEQSISK
jgi:chemotaxis receptor (MCP) glutamine deamidase CheD